MIYNSGFKAPWWLTNRHLQTMWSTMVNRKVALNICQERVNLPDGDFLDLAWEQSQFNNKNTPIVILLHGLAGSIESKYAKGLLRALASRGWRAVLMHFRGCSHEANRLDRIYHSGETKDLAFVVQHLQQQNPDVPIATIGISLGGNVLLKWLGETGENNPLHAAVAVSVPFELAKLADHMQVGIARFYQWWLIRKMKRMLVQKYLQRKAPFDLHKLHHEYHSFWLFDEHITAPLHGFNNAKEYYALASSRQYIKSIRIPTLILQAKDDPFMTPCVIPTLDDLTTAVRLELSEQGGHVGFVTGTHPFKAVYWLEQRIPEFLGTQLACHTKKP